MAEADMYGPLWKGANANGWALFRIADGSVGKKPADIAGAAPGGFGVLLEVKQMEDRPPGWDMRFPTWPRYQRHQIAWLCKYAEAGAIALAVEQYTASKVTRAYIITDARHAIWGGGGPVPASVELVMHDGVYTGWAQILRIWADLTADRPPLGRIPS